ncbi:hypothetical protein RHSIM_Rhsim08G0132800 [Rhododendron simsii]|uniref:MULE transposase domain-containing protein n=1 Tax=Rhododendron simsii TaxID=118357 RepID=A0A834LFI6_RHOSS|nr:hypothetical protein RHSIM_Rhsim08G0132800 [Rhododendron simsii]
MLMTPQKKLMCFCYSGGERMVNADGVLGKYSGGVSEATIIEEGISFDELVTKVCSRVDISHEGKTLFYSTSRDKSKHLRIKDEDGVSMLFHLNDDEVDIYVQEETVNHLPCNISSRESNLLSCSPSTAGGGTCSRNEVEYDTNDQLFPVAYVVVSSENYENWLWFMQNLKETVGDKAIVLVTDRNISLLRAVKEVSGEEFNAWCVSHVKENFSKFATGKGLRGNPKSSALDLFTKLAHAFQGEDQHRYLCHDTKVLKACHDVEANNLLGRFYHARMVLEACHDFEANASFGSFYHEVGVTTIKRKQERGNDSTFRHRSWSLMDSCQKGTTKGEDQGNGATLSFVIIHGVQRDLGETNKDKESDLVPSPTKLESSCQSKLRQKTSLPPAILHEAGGGTLTWQCLERLRSTFA